MPSGNDPSTGQSGTLRHNSWSTGSDGSASFVGSDNDRTAAENVNAGSGGI